MHHRTSATTFAAAADLTQVDACTLSEAIRSRAVSCVEVMTAFLERIDELNPHVNALVSLRDRAALLDEARVKDRDLDEGRHRGWMHGMPHAVKDLSDVAGLPTTKGSPLLRENVPAVDAPFVKRIREAGAIIIGKTNTPEFGLGSQTYNPVFGVTRNPYDLTRTAGGSSGGAAAALALGMLPVADGTDFMGSLRNPAGFNNVVGFRPSLGRVPETGFVGSLAVAGPMARTVADAAMLLSVMAGPDSRAPLSLPTDPAVFAESLFGDFAGRKIAWVGDFDGYLATEPGVLEVCEQSFAVFESLGCVVEAAVPAMSASEVWESFLQWRHWLTLSSLGAFYYDELAREHLKPEAIWELENGLRLTARDICGAMASRDRWYASVCDLLEDYDFILAPTAQVFPFDADLHWPTEIAGRAMDTYHRWMETVAPWSLTSLPIAGLPAGFGAAGLPAGVQLIGRHQEDLEVLRLAHAYDQATQWSLRCPPVTDGWSS